MKDSSYIDFLKWRCHFNGKESEKHKFRMAILMAVFALIALFIMREWVLSVIISQGLGSFKLGNLIKFGKGP